MKGHAFRQQCTGFLRHGAQRGGDVMRPAALARIAMRHTLCLHTPETTSPLQEIRRKVTRRSVSSSSLAGATTAASFSGRRHRQYPYSSLLGLPRMRLRRQAPVLAGVPSDGENGPIITRSSVSAHELSEMAHEKLSWRRSTVGTVESEAVLSAWSEVEELSDRELGELTEEAYLLSHEVNTPEDPHRPVFHLMPTHGWLNDPNGPIYYKGRYHLFYQHLPGPCSEWAYGIVWGHASSKDLVHWRREHIALSPTPRSYDSAGCFSGCAVVDTNGSPTLLYTGVRLRSDESFPLPPENYDLQLPFIESQLAAVAVDRKLAVWRKLSQPVVELPPPQDELPLTGWRDPFILKPRTAGNESNEWVMLIGSGIKGVGGTVLLYRSAHLSYGWSYSGTLCTGDLRHGYMWECPLLVQLPPDADEFYSDVDTSSDRLDYMLCVSPDDPSNPTLYWIGHFDGEHFDLENADGPYALDLGNTLYAPNTMVGPKGRPLLWGWIQEVRLPSTQHSYAGCMTVPRVLSRSSDGRLMQRPAREVNRLRGREPMLNLDAVEVGDEQPVSLEGIYGTELDIIIRLERQGASASGLKMRSFWKSDPAATSGDMSLLFDWNHGVLDMVSDAESEGVTPNRVGGPLSHDRSKPLELRILLDGSVVEVYASSGEVLSTRVYRGAIPYDCKDAGLSLVSMDGATTASVEVFEMESIWKRPAGEEGEDGNIDSPTADGDEFMVPSPIAQSN